MSRLRTSARNTKICPACGEKSYVGTKRCPRNGCTYSWAPVKYREDTCRQNYLLQTSILNPITTFSVVSKESKVMKGFSQEDYTIQKNLPVGTRYLGNNQYFDAAGKAIGEPKYAATYPDFEGGKIFYANDSNKLTGLCWRIVHCKLKNMPSDYKKNGCGVER